MRKKLYINLETIIYILFIILDILKIDTSIIKYLGIIICLIYTTTNKDKCLSLAFIFTILADFFLLVIDRYYEIGVSSFIIVQMIYAYYLKPYHFNLRIITLLSGILLLLIIKQVSPLYLLTICYFTQLISNTIISKLHHKTLLFIGFLLFVCCDISVGIHNISKYNSIYKIASFLMWVFYLPSQVLIALNAKGE